MHLVTLSSLSASDPVSFLDIDDDAIVRHLNSLESDIFREIKVCTRVCQLILELY
jgi:hypothetical protein